VLVPARDSALAGEEFEGETDFESFGEVLFGDRGDVGSRAGVDLH